MESSPTRAQTRVPCIGRQILNHCATREAPALVHLSTAEALVYDKSWAGSDLTSGAIVCEDSRENLSVPSLQLVKS